MHREDHCSLNCTKLLKNLEPEQRGGEGMDISRATSLCIMLMKTQMHRGDARVLTIIDCTGSLITSGKYTCRAPCQQNHEMAVNGWLIKLDLRAYTQSYFTVHHTNENIDAPRRWLCMRAHRIFVSHLGPWEDWCADCAGSMPTLRVSV